MAIRYGRGDVKQTTAGFRVLLMVQSLTSAKSKFLSLFDLKQNHSQQSYWNMKTVEASNTQNYEKQF